MQLLIHRVVHSLLGVLPLSLTATCSLEAYEVFLAGSASFTSNARFNHLFINMVFAGPKLGLGSYTGLLPGLNLKTCGITSFIALGSVFV